MMKIFVFSLCALGVLVGGIVANCFYVNSVTHEMQEALASLPECGKAAKEADALSAYWQQRERLLGLSVSESDMREISKYLIEMSVATKENDEEAFELARALCLDGITRIQDLERFSFLHIL